MGRIIERDRSVIPACDMPLMGDFRDIVRHTHDVEGIGGYKIGFTLGLRYGLLGVVETARQFTDKPLIYDHQKAGTDIPETGKQFAEVCKKSGVDAVILFPQSGPVTAYEWIRAAQDQELGVIVGGEMTHPRYLEGDFSNGEETDYTKKFMGLMDRDWTGFIRGGAPLDIYEFAAGMGVTNFVVPGNKPDKVRFYKNLVERCGVDEPVFYAPGFVAQGGDISETAEAAGDYWHAIVGRGIYTADDKRQAALEHTSKL